MKSGMTIDGVDVPYEVETGGPDVLRAYLDDPEGWQEERDEARKAEIEEQLEDALGKMSAEQLRAHAGSLGVSLESGSGKGGAVLKQDWVEAIIHKQTGG